ASEVSFSPDGRRLVGVGQDKNALVWDLTNPVPGTRRVSRLGPDALKTRWELLAAQEAPSAYQAMWELVALSAEATPWLREHLQPIEQLSGKSLRSLVDQLDSKSPSAREAATKRLAVQGEAVEAPLREILPRSPSPEVRRRIEDLLAKLSHPPTSERLRHL